MHLAMPLSERTHTHTLHPVPPGRDGRTIRQTDKDTFIHTRAEYTHYMLHWSVQMYVYTN